MYLSKIVFLIINLFLLESGAFFLDIDKLPLRVASFNIQRFGHVKASMPDVMGSIAQILSRYDFILIMEVQGKDNESMNKLLSILNKDDNDAQWAYVASQNLGRHTYKEQYVFLYRTSLVTLEDTYQIPDDEDIYQREPFSVKIRYNSMKNSSSRSVAFIGLHSRPKSVKSELEQLEKDIKMLASHWPQTDGVIAMGDFNADCRYLSYKKRKALDILTSRNGFKSLISDFVDTTVSFSNCAYDRLIIYGKGINVKNARAYNFQKDMNMTMCEAKTVSDHYPIEFQLY